MSLKKIIAILLIATPASLWAQNNTDEQNISIHFTNITLEKALKKINEQFNISIAFDNTEAKRHLISADFDSIPFIQVLNKLALMANMEVSKIDHVYVLKPISDKTKVKLIDISSKVEDIGSQEPLPYALVHSASTNSYAITNIQGHFTLLNIPDTALIKISYLGYKDTLVAIKSIKNTIQLKPDPSLLKEVIVNDQGSTTIEYGEEIGKISFNPTATERLPVLGGNDIFRALQLLPGISGTNETSSGLVIRSSSPDKTLILLDGYSLYHVDHFYGIYSSFNSKAIKNIQLYKGGFSAKYGGRASSVLLLTAKDGNRSKFSGDISLNLVDANAVLEIPLNHKLTFIIAGRRSLTDVIDNYLFKELFDKAVINSGDINNSNNLNYKELNPTFNFGDLNFKATYRPTLKDQISLSFYSSVDNLGYEYTSTFENVLDYTTAERSRWGNIGFSTLWAKQWSKKFTSQAQIAYSTYYSNTLLTDIYNYNDSLGIADEEYLQAQDNNVIDFSTKIDNQLITSNNSVISFGLSSTRNSINLLSIINENEFPIFNQDGFQLQFYGDFLFNISPHFESTIGLRTNYFNLTNKIYWEPKVNLKYIANDWLSLKGSWAINNQMISRILRLDLFTSNPDFWVLSNLDLPVMNSKQVAAGLHLNFNIATVDMEAFYAKTTDAVEYLPRLRNFDTQEKNLDQLYTVGNNTTQGVELLIEKGFGNYSGWLGYTLSNSLNDFKDINGGKKFPSRFDQRHEIKLANMLTYGNWNFSINWIYGSGKPYSAPEGSYTITTLDGSKITNSAYSLINNKRLPDYHRLDFSATYNLSFKQTKAKVGLSIFNLYNRTNVKYRRFSKITFDENGAILNNDRFIVTDITLLGITPSVFINWSF